jgi:hypothetical protein
MISSRTRFIVKIFLIALCLSTSLSCSKQNAEPNSSSGPNHSCAGVCERMVKCQFMFSLDECLKDCALYTNPKMLKAIKKSKTCDDIIKVFNKAMPPNQAAITTTMFRINAAVSKPEKAVEIAGAGEQENQWMHYFHLGQAAGRHTRKPSALWLEYAKLVPENMKANYYDGLADGADLSGDDPEALFDSLEAVVEKPYRSFFYFGVFLDYTMRFGQDPKKCEEFFSRFDEKYPADILKGLSIGIVRLFKDDWVQAISTINQFSEKYRESCFEELGWQIGDATQKDIARGGWEIGRIPEKYRGAAYHGYIRSLEFEGAVEPIEDIIVRIPRKYWPDCYRALGWKISVKYWGASPQERLQYLNRLRNKEFIPYAAEKINNPLASEAVNQPDSRGPTTSLHP